jgi:aspartyl-tRNA synthetase
MHQYRTHNCGELNKSYLNKQVKISGWVNKKRDHGDLLFLDIRDFYGITQCVIDASKANKNEIDNFAKIKLESVITVTGTVIARDTNTINNNLDTGDIEITIESLNIESPAQQIPFQITDEKNKYPEELRLKYRFLDLRRAEMQKNIKLRAEIIAFLRTEMQKLGFIEIQTPILTASSPEGARDFLVPSRLNPGKFYALPQAPQQFKQLLMTSGIDKYFQIAPCFRDEDARADRSPGEFYQLDMEMSFVEQEDIFNVIEPVLTNCFKKFSNKKIILENNKFSRITYKDAIDKYGTDKPDLRINIKIVDQTNIFIDSDFKIFKENIKKGAVVKAIKAPNTANKPRKFFDDMINYALEEGAGGLAYIIYNEDGTIKSPIAKLLGDEKLDQIKKTAHLKNGDAIFFACEEPNKAAKIAGKVRIKIAEICELIDKNIFHFCWITDFPFYELDPDTNKIDFSHNPFSMPNGGLEALKTQDPLEITSKQYDIVCNGIELSSGAIRNHSTDIMYEAFKIAGYDESIIKEKFGALINAFQYGAPPHGGIAPGIERIIMLLANTENIREITAFPMNGQAQDLLMNAPNYVNQTQLQELNINLSKKALQIISEKNND